MTKRSPQKKNHMSARQPGDLLTMTTQVVVTLEVEVYKMRAQNVGMSFTNGRGGKSVRALRADTGEKQFAPQRAMFLESGQAKMRFFDLDTDALVEERTLNPGDVEVSYDTPPNTRISFAASAPNTVWYCMNLFGFMPRAGSIGTAAPGESIAQRLPEDGPTFLIILEGRADVGAEPNLMAPLVIRTDEEEEQSIMARSRCLFIDALCEVENVEIPEWRYNLVDR